MCGPFVAECALNEPKVTETLNTYQSSERLGSGALVWLAVGGLPLAVALGYVLAWAQGLADGFIASALCSLLAMVVVALCFSTLFDRVESRSVLASSVAAGTLLLVLLGVRWAVSDRAGFGMGAVLGALLEGGLVAVFSLVLVRQQARAPFSEKIGVWAQEDMQGELWSGATTAEEMVASLQAQGIAVLLSMPWAADFAVEPLASQWQTVEVLGRWVVEDEDSRWISVKLKHHERTEAGGIAFSMTSVVEHWHVSDADYRALRGHLTHGLYVPDEDEPSDEAPIRVELQAALAARQAKQHELCLGLAQAHCQHPDPTVRVDARRLCALSCAGLRQWSDAFEHYQHLYALEVSALNALQLATTSVMAGDVPRGESWFRQARTTNHDAQEMPEARLRTAYLSALEQAGEFKTTQSHLDWLAGGYMAMGITDDHFVWSRGFPFFGEFLAKSQALLGQVMPMADLVIWYERMHEALDDPGRQRLARHLAALQECSDSA